MAESNEFKVIPHPPIGRVRGMDTNEAEALEYENG